MFELNLRRTDGQQGERKRGVPMKIQCVWEHNGNDSIAMQPILLVRLQGAAAWKKHYKKCLRKQRRICAGKGTVPQEWQGSWNR